MASPKSRCCPATLATSSSTRLPTSSSAGPRHRRRRAGDGVLHRVLPVRQAHAPQPSLDAPHWHDRGVLDARQCVWIALRWGEAGVRADVIAHLLRWRGIRIRSAAVAASGDHRRDHRRWCSPDVESPDRRPVPDRRAVRARRDHVLTLSPLDSLRAGAERNLKTVVPAHLR